VWLAKLSELLRPLHDGVAKVHVYTDRLRKWKEPNPQAGRQQTPKTTTASK